MTFFTKNKFILAITWWLWVNCSIAQTIDPNTITVGGGSISGVVNCMAEDANYLYVGGDFKIVGNPTQGAFLDTQTGATLYVPEISGTVHASISDGNGGWYIGGDFTSVGGVKVSNLAHILANKQLDQNYKLAIDGIVYALAMHDNKLYVGGLFHSVTQYSFYHSRNGLFRMNTLTNLVDANWIPDTGNTCFGGGVVYTLVLHENSLYAGGRLKSEYTSLPIKGIIKFSTGADAQIDTSFDLLFPCCTTTIRKLLIYGNTMYIGGYFKKIQNKNQENLARINLLTKQLDESWYAYENNGFDIRDLVLWNDYLVVGGNFFVNNSDSSFQEWQRLIRISVTGTGTRDAYWNPIKNEYNTTVTSLLIYDNNLFVGAILWTFYVTLFPFWMMS